MRIIYCISINLSIFAAEIDPKRFNNSLRNGKEIYYVA